MQEKHLINKKCDAGQSKHGFIPQRPAEAFFQVKDCFYLFVVLIEEFVLLNTVIDANG